MTTTAPAVARVTAGPMPAAPARRFGPAAAARGALLVTLVVVVWEQAPSMLSAVTSALRQTLTADGRWLLGGFAAAATSMVAFGVLRQRTLRAAGARMSLAEATTASYAAGAVHLTAPAGAVVSTGYLFRRLQRAGVKPAAIAYSLAVSGVVCSVTLAMIAVGGFLVNGSTADWGTIAVGVVGAIGLAAVTFWAVRRPRPAARAVESMLRRLNRVLRRPPESGLITLRATLDDLRQVRPTALDWATITTAAAANWLLDLGCLWACAHALGVQVSPLLLLTGYAVAMAGGGVSPLPGGIGIVDGVLVLALTSTGAPLAAALSAVLLYRVLSNGNVIIGGWAALAARSARRRWNGRAKSPDQATGVTCCPRATSSADSHTMTGASATARLSRQRPLAPGAEGENAPSPPTAGSTHIQTA